MNNSRSFIAKFQHCCLELHSCVPVCVCIHVRVHMCACIPVRAPVCLCTHVHLCVYPCACTPVYPCVCIPVRAYPCACAPVCVCTCVPVRALQLPPKLQLCLLLPTLPLSLLPTRERELLEGRMESCSSLKDKCKTGPSKTWCQWL